MVPIAYRQGEAPAKGNVARRLLGFRSMTETESLMMGLLTVGWVLALTLVPILSAARYTFRERRYRARTRGAAYELKPDSRDRSRAA